MKILSLLLLSVSVFASTATLTWTDTINPTGTQYNVYRASGACVAAPAYVKITATPISPKTYVDSTLQPGNDYCFSVTAVSSGQESVKSVPVLAVVPAPTSAAPTGLTAVVVP